MPFTNERNKASLEKWLILGLGYGKYKPGKSVVPENKEMIEKGWGHVKRVQEPA